MTPPIDPTNYIKGKPVGGGSAKILENTHATSSPIDPGSVKTQIAQAFGLVQNPDLPRVKHWYIKTDLYDDDFEEVTGHQYHNAEEELDAVVALFTQELEKARTKDDA